MNPETKGVIEFVSYWISDLHFVRRTDFIEGKPEKLDINLNITPGLAEDGKNIAELTMAVEAKTESGTISLSVTITGLFRGADDLPLDAFHKYVTSYGPAILFPFARAIISSVSVQANIPAIIIPTVNFTKVTPKQTEVESPKPDA